TKVAFVSTLNSSYENEHGNSLKGKMYRNIDAWTNWRTDRYIAVSNTIRDGLLKAGIPEQMIGLVRNSIEINNMYLVEESSALRQRIGIPQDAVLSVLVGRLVWAKGYDDFIRAFAIVAQQIPDAYAVIAGDGELYSAIASQIKQAGLEQKIV